MPPLPRALTRFVERPEQTPDERFQVYLRGVDAESPRRAVPGASGSPAVWRRTWITLALAAGAIAVSIGRNVVG